MCLCGLSPRVRGNRLPIHRIGHNRRSIPTCAGEPGINDRPRDTRRVYPHVCGGTFCPALHATDIRSIPTCAGEPASWYEYRSIPTCAGEPRLTRRLRSCRAVYPHVCGGTSTGLLLSFRVRGLSPRVRGNLHTSYCRQSTARSIPTCAGEPHRCAVRCTAREVYPHVCGGTSVLAIRSNASTGLSPRVRGNLVNRPVGIARRGSIPTCAGEPDAGQH